MGQGFDANLYRKEQQKNKDFSKFKVNVFLSAMLGIVTLVAVGLFGYNQFTDYKTDQEASRQLQAQMEIKKPPISDIDAAIQGNPIMRMQMARAEKMVNDHEAKKTAIKEMPITDYVKAKDLTGFDAQQTKYRRTTQILDECGSNFSDIYFQYAQKNRERLSTLRKTAKDNSTVGEWASSQAALRDKAKDVKTQGDALKFAFSGEMRQARKSAISMQFAMNDMMNEIEGNGPRKAKNQSECLQVKQLAQTGQLDIRLN